MIRSALKFTGLLTLLLAAGCATTTSTSTSSTLKKESSPWKTVPAKQAQPKKAAAIVVPEAAPNTRILPFNAHIVSVKPDLRFVLIDFTNSRRPSLDERLSVYRVGQKVAEIKVSGPFLNTTVAADVLAGEAKYGDEVKAD
jgi:hypothetical protein